MNAFSYAKLNTFLGVTLKFFFANNITFDTTPIDFASIMQGHLNSFRAYSPLAHSLKRMA